MKRIDRILFVTLAIVSVFMWPRSDQAAAAAPGDALEAYLQVFPETKAIGVIYSEARHEEAIKELTAKAKSKKIAVIVSEAPTIKELPPSLRQMQGKVDTLWVLDDQLYSMEATWNFLIMYTLRSRIKTVVMTEKAMAGGGLFRLSESKEAIVNKRILEVLGCQVSEQADAIKYFGGEATDGD